MKKKVVIEITDGHRYDSSVKGGKAFTSVDYMASTYGAACPCDWEGEVAEAVARSQQDIRANGDIPVVQDKRITLLRYLGSG
ncbi:hypothetical protein [Cerasicoccus maritimus]|uniref:hypothetical protein n=1 Tax=Cerasicoccus maritimus TaxID=490089 RepID=UPI002852CAC0|nr:hypothetical protein [Cerasicoccus maritimus]